MIAATMVASMTSLWPGLLLSAGVAVAAVLAEPALKAFTSAMGLAITLPATVWALLIGMALHGFAGREIFKAGITYAVKKLLRFAIALLGLRIALSDIAALGLDVALLVVVSMALTLASGFWFARLLGREAGYGALAGAATAVCGASAALATSTVVPPYRDHERDTAFTVVAANALSTLVMVAYPPLCLLLGLTALDTGIMLGATIHDMAQVVGAGYAVSEPVGNTAVIVKLFRVFLLLPIVLAVGFYFSRAGTSAGTAKVPVPVFALAFLALCLVNSFVPAVPALDAVYQPVKALLSEASRWGLLIAIAALGLGTSITAIMRIGWRHIAVFAGTSLVLLVLVTGGLFLIG